MKIKDNFRVLLVAPSPPPVGGIQSWTVNLLNYFHHQENIGLCYEDTTVKYRGILEIGLWKRIIAGIRVTNDVVKAVRKSVHTNKPSVIHLTSSASLALFKDFRLLLLARKFKIPLIIHWHFGRIPELATKKNWEWHLLSYIIRKTAYSIVIDDHSYKALIDAGFKNVANIANPVSEELARNAREQRTIERAPEIGKVVFVGHVFVNKGIYELLEACILSPLVKKLILVGPVDEEVKTKLENIAKKRADNNWLILTGPKSREDVYSEIRSAELIALPSYTEGFPITIIEAMALGCPVVATSVGAIPEMLNIGSDFPAGLCVPARDIDSLKLSIEKILSNKELGTKYGQNGADRVFENFNMKKIFKEYQKVWLTAAKN